jgi:hypothetical protein
MTKLLRQALEAVQKLPPESQDEIARAMLTLAGDEGASEPIDQRICLTCWKAWRKRDGGNLPVMLKLKQRFAASTNEAAVHAVFQRSCPRLSRASTSCRQLKSVAGRGKPGHDHLVR